MGVGIVGGKSAYPAASGGGGCTNSAANSQANQLAARFVKLWNKTSTETANGKSANCCVEWRSQTTAIGISKRGLAQQNQPSAAANAGNKSA
jgi:hypothetical protein